MKLVLLDRDGVINENLDTGVLRLADFRLLPGACEAIARLTQAGYKVVICTNQSAVGRGLLSQETLDALHASLQAEVMRVGGVIDAFYVAPDRPEAASHRRKPGPGMLLEALAAYDADPSQTFFVGDALRDLEAAHAAGCLRILTRTGHGAALAAAGIPSHVSPVTVVDDLSTAVAHILQVQG